MTDKSLIEFPCDFLIKIIGINSAIFFDDIKNIVEKHFPKKDCVKISSKLSKNDNYLAISATVYAQNQLQLDNLYRELTAHSNVKMVL
jgi:putative lipoic acid-binding regulatory protein